MKSFHRISRVLFLFAILSLCFGGSASAALIGLTPSYPDLFAYGSFEYDASNDLLTITATPFLLFYSAGSMDGISNGTNGYIAKINANGSGSFLTGGLDNTLTISGMVGDGTVYNGTLLTGNITNFGWEMSTYPDFDFTFDITGGQLAGLFGSYGGAIIHTENSTFSSWNEDFGGTFVKVDNFPVPIPATAWIFGAGLVGLVGIRRKLRS